MNCTICHKPIVLTPSAAERAAKDVSGKSASYYTKLFTSHSACLIAKQSAESVELMKRINDDKPRTNSRTNSVFAK